MAATPAIPRKAVNIWSPALTFDAANCEATLAAASNPYAVPSTDLLTSFIISETFSSSFNKPCNWKCAFSRFSARRLPPSVTLLSAASIPFIAYFIATKVFTSVPIFVT